MSAKHHADALRPGETQLTLPQAQDAVLRFIGTIRTPFTERALCPRQGDPAKGPLCRIEIAPEFEPGLLGLETFERVEVYYWLHEARRDLITQSPKGDGQLRGTFSLRSPLRPNPIGMSDVAIVGRDKATLHVRALDCRAGTRLLDIKPPRCGYAVQAPDKPMSSTGGML